MPRLDSRYEIRAQDGAGNNSAPSVPLAATFDPSADRIPPSTPSGVSGSVGATSITLSWRPSIDNVGVRGYLVHRDGQLRAWVPAGTTLTDSGLVGGRPYRYELRAQDAAGNNSAPSPEVTLTPGGPGPDTTPPSTPTGLRGGATGQSLWPEWSPATDNVGVAGYLVHRASVFRAWVPSGTRYTDSGVVAGQSYRYEVRAQDAVRNNSGPSAPLTLVAGGSGDPPLEGLDGPVVTSWGNDATAASASRPYGSLTVAARAAPAGASIHLSNGVFREGVSLVGKSLKIRAVPGAAPVLSGADRVTAWTASGGRWWAPGPAFADTGWPGGMTSSARSALVDIVVVDDARLRQVNSSGEITAATSWVDSANRVWIGRDPAANVVEIAMRTRGVFARDVDGFTVEGVTLRHYASGPGDMGALEIWGTRTVVRDVAVPTTPTPGSVWLAGRPCWNESVRSATGASARRCTTSTTGSFAPASSATTTPRASTCSVPRAASRPPRPARSALRATR